MAKVSVKPSVSVRALPRSCPVAAWAEAVVDGRVVAGPHVRAAARRHLRDLDTGSARGLRWDAEAAARPIRYFSTVLRLSEGQFEDRPFDLHESQQFMVGSLYGWKKADGFRRFRRAYIEEGKGNGKSPLAGGLGLYATGSDNEPGAQVYSAASRKEQAAILFNDAVNMVQKAPALRKRFRLAGANPVWSISHPKSGSFFRPISREAGKKSSGIRPHMALIDEVHEVEDRSVIDLLERGFKFRQQPMLVMITNSGSDPNSICGEEHDHAVKVVQGDVEDDATFSFVCGVDEKEDPLLDESCWIKANPLLGTILTKDYLRDVVNQARMMPGKQNGILRLHFCVWTDAPEAWMTRAAWMAIEEDLNLEDYRGRECYGGLDLSFTKDLTAMSLIFPRKEDRRWWDGFVEYWTPGATMREREARDKIPYERWVADGYIRATTGSVVATESVAARIAEVQEQFDLRAIGYDRYRHKELADDMKDLGVDPVMIEHPQGFRRVKDSPLWMPHSVELLENAILEKNGRVQKSPVTRYCVGSTVVRNDPSGVGNRVFDKAKATGRIDGTVALAIGVGTARRYVDESVNIDDFLRNAVMV